MIQVPTALVCALLIVTALDAYAESDTQRRAVPIYEKDPKTKPPLTPVTPRERLRLDAPTGAIVGTTAGAATAITAKDTPAQAAIATGTAVIEGASKASVPKAQSAP